MASIKPKSSKRNPRRRRHSRMAENQTTVTNNGIINYGTINHAPSEPPPGSQRNWLARAIRAVLRMALIIALFYA